MPSEYFVAGEYTWFVRFCQLDIAMHVNGYYVVIYQFADKTEITYTGHALQRRWYLEATDRVYTGDTRVLRVLLCRASGYFPKADMMQLP